VTQILRKEGVVNKFSNSAAGLAKMKLADPRDDRQHGAGIRATMGFFPVDGATLEYMRRTGRTAAEVSSSKST